ncbi:RNI-like protein [Gigaspora margarita]|uniref:RNI-like protein n=1 Tax=Gigaspora margarita TaxID=4874 RepID=A0A8H3X4V4_GIGMA|nr:RNI-like protein [Gigaspora margarita]
MFLRKSKKFKTLSCSQLGFDKEITLANAFSKKDRLTTLALFNNNLESVVENALADTFCKNNALIFLDLSSNQLGSNGRKALAKVLCKNNTLATLVFSNNNLESVVEIP